MISLPHVLACATLPLLLAAACGGRAATNAAAADRDLESAPTFGYEETLRLGDANDPNVGFTSIGDVAVDNDNRLYVYESHDRQIRVYSPDGRRILSIGRPGEGPGEFTTASPSWVRIGVLGDTVWVLEHGTAQFRTFLFHRSGELLATSRGRAVDTRVQIGSAALMPHVLRRDRLYTSHIAVSFPARQRDAEVGSADTMLVPRILFNLDGTVRDTIGWDKLPPRSDEVQRIAIQGVEGHPIPGPWEPGRLVVNLPDGRYFVFCAAPAAPDSAFVRIVREALHGDTLFDVVYSFRPVRYPDVVLDSIAAASARIPGGGVHRVDGVDATGSFADSLAARRLIRRYMNFPEYQVPVQGTFLGADGALWLRRERDGSGTHRWVIVEDDGRLRGSLELPARMRLMWAAGNSAWVVQHDENGVPFLSGLRISAR